MSAEPPRRSARLEPPLAVQIVILLCACLVLAQVATALVIVFLPPPPPPIYHLAEVAAALSGRPVSAPMAARPLQRTTASRPPEVGQQDLVGRRALATLLRVRESEVSLSMAPPSALGRVSGAAGAWIRRGDGDQGPPPGVIVMRQADLGQGFAVGWRDRHPPFRFAGDPGRPVFGRFAAAVRHAPGQWIVVRPAAEPFPNPWQRRVLAWLGLSFALTAPLGYLFARRLTAPLRRFAGAARRFGADPTAPQMELNGPAEIGEAAIAFNDMQRRLKRFIDDRTAMVGAISHDLRTPLARIRFKLEKAPAPVRRSIARDLEQMDEMIGAVLDFIRDAHARRTREVLDLASVVECVVDDAAAAGGMVCLGRMDRLAVGGDPMALQRLFANLIDNAVKYGGAAEVSVEQRDGDAVVRVSDRGPGLPESELERVFEPFYRTDASRNLDVGGIGLGLAVARSLAREHGGDVVLTSSALGLTATVWLPLAGGGLGPSPDQERGRDPSAHA